MAAVRSIRTKAVGRKTAATKRTRVLTTEMQSEAPTAKTRVVKKTVAKKAPARKKPVAKKAVVDEIADEIAPTLEWNEPRDPRTPGRSATERLDDPPPADGPLLIARVANAIERELTQIEIIVGNNRVLPRHRTEAERRARTLASLARTLSVVTQLREKTLQKAEDDDDAVPRDLDEFRETLARRLERLLAERPQPADGEPDAN